MILEGVWLRILSMGSFFDHAGGFLILLGGAALTFLIVFLAVGLIRRSIKDEEKKR